MTAKRGSLALAPAIVLIISLYSDRLELFSSIGTAMLACGALFMLSELARQRGKEKENILWKSWGAPPSTQVLRHRDDTFEMVSKTRYHKICSTLLGQPFPDRQQEKAAPDLADAVYASACNMLREATRDKEKFSLLFKDLTAYGFWRNGYGLRAIGAVISLSCLVWVVIRHGLTVWTARLQAAPNLEALLSGEELMTVAVALIMLVMWCFVFTEQTVRAAARVCRILCNRDFGYCRGSLSA